MRIDESVDDSIAKDEEARNIAVEVGALDRCGMHPDEVVTTGTNEVDAYKLANYRFTHGLLVNEWESLGELADRIEDVIAEASDGCPSCGL